MLKDSMVFFWKASLMSSARVSLCDQHSIVFFALTLILFDRNTCYKTRDTPLEHPQVAYEIKKMHSYHFQKKTYLKFSLAGALNQIILKLINKKPQFWNLVSFRKGPILFSSKFQERCILAPNLNWSKRFCLGMGGLLV